jgi:hypothetical protein
VGFLYGILARGDPELAATRQFFLAQFASKVRHRCVPWQRTVLQQYDVWPVGISAIELLKNRTCLRLVTAERLAQWRTKQRVFTRISDLLPRLVQYLPRSIRNRSGETPRLETRVDLIRGKFKA